MKSKLFAGIALLALASPAAASGSMGGLDERIPACGDPHVLATIGRRYDHAAKNLHHDASAITRISKVHQHRVEEAGARSPIMRRYCGAVARMNDGRDRTLWYLIEDGQGLAGYGDNVEFCIAGLDPLRVYGVHCRVLR